MALKSVLLERNVLTSLERILQPIGAAAGPCLYESFACYLLNGALKLSRHCGQERHEKGQSFHLETTPLRGEGGPDSDSSQKEGSVEGGNGHGCCLDTPV